MKKTICELFAGVGGFRVGLEKSSPNWQTVWSNQWEPSKKVQHAYECYKSHFQNFGGIDSNSNIDISKVPTEEIPNHSLLVGGFPCQDYSVASTGAKGIHGKKGVLWWEIERIIKDKQPPFILLENVDRLVKSPTNQRGRDFGIMLSCLYNLNYSVEWRIINAADYGFQQRRKRIFIFASKKDTNYEKNNNSSIKNMFEKSSFFSSIFPVNTIEENKISSVKISEDILSISESFKFGFCNSGFMKDGIVYTVDTIPKNILTPKQINLIDILEKNVDKKYFLSDMELEKWQYLKGAKAIIRTAKTGHSYTFREGAIAFPDYLDKPARTMLTSEASINRSSHIVLDLDTKRYRKLTPIECERVNGFPDNWTNTGMPESFRYFCMGNALVVNLIEIMGRKLSEIIKSED